MGPSKNNRKLRKASYVIVSVLLLLGFSSFVLPTHGQPTNTSICDYMSTSAASSFLFTINSAFIGSCTFNANYLVVLIVETYSSSVTVTGITDSASNSYAQLVGQTNTIAETGGCAHTNGMATSMWFSNLGTSPTTFTVTLSGTAIANTNGQDINVIAMVFNPNGALYGKSSANSTGGTVFASGTNGNPADTGTTHLQYGTYTVPTDGIVVTSSAWNLGVSCGQEGNVGTRISANSPLSPVFDQAQQAGAGFYIPTSTVTQAFQTSARMLFSVNCGSPACPWTLPFISVSAVLTFQGNLPPNCGPNNQAGVVIGSTLRSASTTAITSNQTDLYVTTISAAGGTILNISTRLSSISLTNGQTSAKLTLGLWLATNTNPTSAQNPLNFQSLASFTWTIVNNANPQTFWVAPNFAVPASSTIAIGLGVSHAGVNGYLTSDSGLTMQVDTADAFSSSKPPTTITVYTAAATPIFFGASTIENCTVSTVTGGSGGSATVTSTQIVVVNQSSPTQGPFWFIPLLFLFIFPAIFMAMGHTAKLEGVVMVYLIMLGLTLGSLIGNMAQVIPMGLTYLLSALSVILAWRIR